MEGKVMSNFFNFGKTRKSKKKKVVRDFDIDDALKFLGLKAEKSYSPNMQPLIKAGQGRSRYTN